MALLCLAGWLSTGRSDSVSGRLASIDAGLYDLMIRLRPLPPPDDVVIIEIDEDSVAQIGRWPWPRGVHATLLDLLTAAGARVIGLDILIAETGPDDSMLSAAIQRSSVVVLPVSSDTDRDGRAWPIYPVYEAGQVSRLGHAGFSFDSDGVVRGLYLTEGGIPAFSVAILTEAKSPIAAPQVKRALQWATKEERELTVSEGLWNRHQFALLPASERTTRRLSYAEVLRGDDDLSGLRGKIVLIGSTAIGMRDAYSSSMSLPRRWWQPVSICMHRP